MYIIGAANQKYDFAINIKKRWFAAAYIFAVLFTWFSRIGIRFIESISGKTLQVDLFVTYTSPFMVLMAFSLFMFFRKLRLPSFINKAVACISPLSFAVYLIHEHEMMVGKFLNGKFKYLAEGNVFVLVGTVIGVAIMIFAVCIIVEYLRVWIFKLLRINRLIAKISETIDTKLKLGL